MSMPVSRTALPNDTHKEVEGIATLKTLAGRNVNTWNPRCWERCYAISDTGLEQQACTALCERLALQQLKPANRPQ